MCTRVNLYINSNLMTINPRKNYTVLDLFDYSLNFRQMCVKAVLCANNKFQTDCTKIYLNSIFRVFVPPHIT